MEPLSGCTAGDDESATTITIVGDQIAQVALQLVALQGLFFVDRREPKTRFR